MKNWENVKGENERWLAGLLHVIPISGSVLYGCMGISERELRRTVASLRAQGYPVSSSPKGYWIEPDVKEFTRHAWTLAQHGLSEIKVAFGMLNSKHRKELAGQLRLIK